jgi:hypothetical protein
MKYISLFESFGVDRNLESQSLEISNIIASDPSAKKFKFLYKNDLGEFPVWIIIDDSLNQAGKFLNYKDKNNVSKKFEIYLRDGNDKGTIIHELKHMDHAIRNKKRSIFAKASSFIRNQENTKLKTGQYSLEGVFYMYDIDEFEARLHNYYKDFDTYLSDKVTNETKLSDIRQLFVNFFESYGDNSFLYYLDKPDKFMLRKIIDERKLYSIINKMIEDGVYDNKNKYAFAKDTIIETFKKGIKNIIQNLGFYKKDRVREINRTIDYFDGLIKQRNIKFRRKVFNLITLMANKYGVKY